MIEGIPRISVRVITYKQETLVKRALDSLLAQKDYIYEICVTDDCSPDGTWDVLQQYAQDNPGLFKLHRNEHNVGIFENNEVSWTMPTGDIVYGLAGDDEAGEGWLKRVVEFIQENKIDYLNEAVCIYGDYQSIYPNGDTYTFHNSLVKNNKNLLKLALRGLIGNRGCCYSINVLKRYHKVSQGRSHIAEDAMDRQLQIFSDKNYYIPHVGNRYYAKIGVSAKVDGNTLKERAQIRPYALNLFESWGVTLDEKDKMYSLECFPAFERMCFNPSIRNVWKWIVLKIKCRDSQIHSKGIGVRDFIFAIRRRLPHKHPVIL